ncbi:MAG: RNA polymerase sporulation sigma factor SigH, partial [Clostridia bacterium]|nr:RNA polymerase sporulation sigma factor SigH [Clostridia bacterium]
GPEQAVLEKEEEQRLHQRLRQRLTPLEYTVLCEHLDGYSYQEIADHLHITCKSADNALQRVRRKLSD